MTDKQFQMLKNLTTRMEYRVGKMIHEEYLTNNDYFIRVKLKKFQNLNNEQLSIIEDLERYSKE